MAAGAMGVDLSTPPSDTILDGTGISRTTMSQCTIPATSRPQPGTCHPTQSSPSQLLPSLNLILAALLFQQPNILSPKPRQHSLAPLPKHPKEQSQYMSTKMGNNILMALALFSRFIYTQPPKALIWSATDLIAEELEEVGNERLGALLSL